MKLTIRSRGLELSPEARAQLQRRLHFAFGRLVAAIRAVDLTITDINGPRGGLDKQCRIRIRGRALRSIVVEHVGADTQATVAVAAERAERALVRALARGCSFTPSLAT